LVETNVAAAPGSRSALRQASYCASLVEQTTETETPIPEIFDLLLGFLSSFQEPDGDESAGNPQRVFAFELRLLTELGLVPDFSGSRLSGQTRELVEQLQSLDWSGVARLNPPTAPAVELRRFLHGFLIYQFDRLARGREAAVAGIY
jgi:recombinational DNA repair protein (RecF pathway)